MLAAPYEIGFMTNKKKEYERMSTEQRDKPLPQLRLYSNQWSIGQ